jgi:hypothetical protein
MDDVNRGVVTNGLDFLASAVDHLAIGDQRNLKYATLHLFASMETLVKARLAREHWTLVVADPRKLSKRAYRAGEARSVTVTQALERLEAVTDVTLSDKSRVSDLEKLRNRAAHFSMQGEKREQVEGIVARGLDFMLHFIEEHLRPEAPPREVEIIDRTLEMVRQTLGRIQALVNERMSSLQPALSEYEFALDCPACRQPCLVLGDHASARCLYCLYGPEGPESAEEYTNVILEISWYEYESGSIEWPVHCCTRCGEEALVDHIFSAKGDEIGRACFACGCYLV